MTQVSNGKMIFAPTVSGNNFSAPSYVATVYRYNEFSCAASGVTFVM